MALTIPSGPVCCPSQQQILEVLAGVLGLSEAGRVQLGLLSPWEQFHRPQALAAVRFR